MADNYYHLCANDILRQLTTLMQMSSGKNQFGVLAPMDLDAKDLLEVLKVLSANGIHSVSLRARENWYEFVFDPPHDLKQAAKEILMAQANYVLSLLSHMDILLREKGYLGGIDVGEWKRINSFFTQFGCSPRP